MMKYEFNGITIIKPDEYSTEAVEAFVGVLADSGVDELFTEIAGGLSGKTNLELENLLAINWITPILKKISQAGLIHRAAACALYELGNEDFSDQAILARQELTRKLPPKITIPAVIDFLSTVIESIKSSMTLLKKLPKTKTAHGTKK